LHGKKKEFLQSSSLEGDRQIILVISRGSCWLAPSKYF